MQYVPKIKTTKKVYPQIYSYTLPDFPENEGSQKIGYTEHADVNKRIQQQTNTAAKQLRYELLWHAPAFFKNPVKDFKDKDFHKFLIKSSIEHRADLGTEWFYFNGTPEKSKQLFDTFREHGFAALQSNTGKKEYKLRQEQEDAVAKAIAYFQANEGGEFLWNAKPRFGKTLASYDLVRRLNAQKVLIVTNRPAIANSWYDDYDDFVSGYAFISNTSSLADRPSLTREEYNERLSGSPQITFLSLQDLKGSKYYGGDHDKLKWVADLDWDILIIDEAHEGVDTSRTDAAFDNVKRKYTLHLSGTPFKALANNKFSEEAIYNWTYLDEQTVKKAELLEGESGEHTDLPDLKLYTYRISQMVADTVNEGVDIDGETRDFAFDLNEFFSVKNQKFVHEEDVKAFLKNLSTNEKYPFSTPELRNELRHTFWYVGNRVDSVKALERLLKQDEVFKGYKVIVAAGDGRTFDEEEYDFKANEKSFDRVKEAVAKYDKTITLSCGQLTTGVTIKEWSAVLMLTDIKTPAQYMQAAFRAQNPYKFTEDGVLKAKQSAYLFDFSPTRVLQIYDAFANALNPKAVNGEVTEDERKQNVRELLNFFPVISEDTEGKMVELDAEQVLTFPNAIAAAEIVKARFMTNLLFNDNIKGVFSVPREVEEILNKMPVEKNKRVETAKSDLDLDDARTSNANKEKKINENTDAILGEKIYRANIERVVENAVNSETREEAAATIAEEAAKQSEALIAKIKTTYGLTNKQTEEIQKQAAEKIRLVAAEYESGAIKNTEQAVEKLVKTMEVDLVGEQVEKQETEAVEKVQKTKEEEIRERLRSFTRTIPMFVMANTSGEQITIDNFDKYVSDEDFLDLTNITKDEFYKLRDGFEFEEDGVLRTFGGVFDRYRFNASIAEFVEEKKKRANYFQNDDDIFELIPNQKNNQIFTPRKVVNMMIDDLQKENPELFTRTDSTFIDLYMKSGMYIAELVKRLFTGTRQHYETDADCVRYILENQVYGLSPTGILHGITNAYIFGFDDTREISTKNFVQHNLLPEAKDGTVAEKLQQLFGRGENMKFDAVVGNPPYQVGTDTNFATPVYNLFIDAAVELHPEVSLLIHPARFLFNAGATPKDWNQKMLNDPHFNVIKYEADSQKIFGGVDIKGGVAITMWNKNQTEGGIGGTFVPFEELRSILNKVKVGGFDEIVGARGETKTTYPLDSKYPNDLRIAPNYFERYPDVFVKSKDEKHTIKIIGLEKGNKRTERYIDRSIVKDPKIEKWKVFIPKSNGSGALGEVVSTPPLRGNPLRGAPTHFYR